MESCLDGVSMDRAAAGLLVPGTGMDRCERGHHQLLGGVWLLERVHEPLGLSRLVWGDVAGVGERGVVDSARLVPVAHLDPAGCDNPDGGGDVRPCDADIPMHPEPAGHGPVFVPRLSRPCVAGGDGNDESGLRNLATAGMGVAFGMLCGGRMECRAPMFAKTVIGGHGRLGTNLVSMETADDVARFLSGPGPSALRSRHVACVGRGVGRRCFVGVAGTGTGK